MSYATNLILKLANAFIKKFSASKMTLKKLTPENLSEMLPGIGETPFEIPIEDAKNWLTNNQSLLDNSKEFSWRQEFDDETDQYFLLGLNPSANIDDSIEEEIHITSSNNQPEFLEKIKMKGFLKGFGSIPNLWYWHGFYGKRTNPLVVSKNLSHNYFIVEAIAKLFLGNVSDLTEKDLESIDRFYLSNENKIRDLRKNFTMQPKLLGSGVDGIAFQINDYQVLKIFRNQASFEDAKKAMERLHKYPDLAGTEANIYDVGIIGEYDYRSGDYVAEYPVYYYIIELMKPVSKIGLEDDPEITNKNNIFLAKTFEYIKNNIISNKESTWKNIKNNLMSKPELHSEIKNKIKERAKEIAEYIYFTLDTSELETFLQHYEKNGFALADNWLELFAEEIIFKYLTGRIDLHLGNLGLRKVGNKHVFRYFDPYYEGRETFPKN